MQMYFAHRNFTVRVERAEDDGFLDTIDGLSVIKKGDMIATNESGSQFVIDENYFYDTYIPVRKLRKTKTPRKSPFEMAEIEESYKQSWVNQEDYIFDIKE
jgi:hypothetical protein